MNQLRAQLIALALILGITGASALAVAALAPPPRQVSSLPTLPPATPVRSPTPVPAILPGPLDGVPTARQLALRRPIAVVIDNFYPDARPQPGLGRASVVYETVTEGGITRLLALFLEHDAGNVGPVRSARPYFVQWAAGYHAIFVHDGGSPAALQALRRTPELADVDSASSSAAFHIAPDSVAPHNLFTSTADVRALALRSGWRPPVSFAWMRHQHAASSAGTDSSAVHIDFSLPTVPSPPQYAVTYRYDPSHNAYLRSVGGQQAIDAATSRPIEPANVAILFTAMAPISNDVAGRVRLGAVGSGSAIYLIGGRVIHGSWSKPSSAGAVQFDDGHHRSIAFGPGATWVEAVPQGAVRFGQ